MMNYMCRYKLLYTSLYILPHVLIRINIKIRFKANNYNYLSHTFLDILIYTLKYIFIII
jgi:hypothetical protein